MKLIASSCKYATRPAAKLEDLDAVVCFANGLFEEKCKSPSFGIMIDRPFKTTRTMQESRACNARFISATEDSIRHP